MRPGVLRRRSRGRRRPVAIVALAALAACGGVATVSAESATELSPTALLRALSRTPFSRAQLPAGYTAATLETHGSDTVRATSPDQVRARVYYSVRGRALRALIVYIEFASASVARGALAHPNLAGSVQITAHSVPAFSSLPGVTWQFTSPSVDSRSGKIDGTDRISAAIVLEGNIAVEASTVNQAGSIPELPVLKSAVAHLKAAEQAAA
jgi:hypothetical protein